MTEILLLMLLGVGIVLIGVIREAPEFLSNLMYRNKRQEREQQKRLEFTRIMAEGEHELKLAKQGVQEFCLRNYESTFWFRSDPLQDAIKSTRECFGDDGRIILELTRGYKDDSPRLFGKLRFVYPEKGIDKLLLEDHYRLPVGLKMWFEPVEFTYVDKPDTDQANVLYFRHVFADDTRGLCIRVSNNSTDFSERKDRLC
jgi:hypothetical protein